MSKELVISANRHETKVAILEDDQLVEIYFQRANEYSLAGSIHKGRVTRVLPGMQSAFVNVGLERDTFLYVSDFFEEHGEDVDGVTPERPVRAVRGMEAREERGRGGRGRGGYDRPRVEAPAPVGDLTPEAADAPVDLAPSAGAAPAMDRGERPRQDDGDRRNRRSRQRNRGRGFPDSKYATEMRGEEEPVRQRSVSIAPAGPVDEPQTGAADFMVLPGETLSKYRRTSARAASVAPAEETANAEEPVERVDLSSSIEEASEPEIETAEAEEAIEAEAEAAQEAAEAVLALGGETQVETAEEEPAEEADEIDELDFVEEVPEDSGGPEAEAEAPGETEAPASEDAAGEQDTRREPALASRAEVLGRPEGLSAQVREHGGRYLQHRVSRRSRRRGRGGRGEERRPDDRRPEERRPEERSAEEKRPETVEAIAPPVEARVVERPERAAMPSISDLLKERQEIIVQIAKEPLGQKGARITSHIALPGRYVVYMPTVEHTGVSRKIGSDEERQRLKRILMAHRGTAPGGFILRTAGEGRTEEEIAADMNFLANLWQDIKQKADKHPAPLLLHHDLDIVQRILRDQLTDSFKSIWVDNEEVYESILRFVQRFQPALMGRVKLFTRPEPIFDAFGVSAELEKALRPKVWLKSGGYIVINQTEALVAIDINTGKYIGKSNRLEDTIVKTNTEAVNEIVRQIRLRDLGGIIVVDFIDMDERKNRQKVMQALEEAMRSDRAPFKILQFNDFGLVAITRKRVKQSLERALCSPCPYCEGAGYVKSVQTTVSEILQEAHKIRAAVEDSKDVILRVHPEVAKVFKSNQNLYLEELEDILGRPVMVKGDPAVHQEKFDLA